MSNNKTLITYAIVSILLLCFAIYSSTMNYAYALGAITYTIGTNYSIYGGDYRISNDSWYFASSNNNTIIELKDNSTIFTTGTYTGGGGTCNDVHDIEVIMNGAFLALICNNSSPATLELQIRSSTAPYALWDFESGFANTEDVYNIAEWVAGNRLYLLNSGAGSPLVYHFNLNNMNSSLSPMFAGSVGAFSASTCYDIVVSEQRSQAYVSCVQLTSNDSSFSVIDLTTFTSSQSVQLDSNTSTGGLQIDVWDGNNTVVVTDSSLGDIWVYSLQTGLKNSFNGSVCTEPVSPQFNTNTGQIFVTCKGNNYIAIYSSVTDTVIATILVQTFSGSAMFGSNNAPKFVWVESQRAGYLAYAFLDAGHGALFNFVTRIEDTSFSSGSGFGGCVVIDTSPLLDVVSLITICDTNNDGIPDSQEGEYPTVGQNTTTLVHQIACQAGIVSCDNTDSKTNGMGLLLLLFLLLMAIGVVMFVTFRTDHSLSDIHPVVWFILVVAVTGVSWQLGWTDAIPFFASVVAICALGAFKVREWFG